jgi:multidrug transporter EmrE-like cation transporter
MRLGTFIDYKTSNLFENNPPHRFRKRQLKALAGNFLPNILGLVFLNLSFKYAALCNLNQGILPTLATLSGFYTAVLFYFKFSEMISCAQIIGMVFMVACVAFLGLEGAAKSSSVTPSVSN